ncbi:hypothetical protein, partial [Azospirillum griseum]|uniref:hypothetical protein n=1 Tax=Azospirillum griseum TaxID=2496639 RepID=UPI001AEC8F18
YNQASGSSYWDIYGQRFDASGNKVGSEFLANSTTATHQALPTVTALTGGGFVVAWGSVNQDSGGTWGSYFQRYDASGAKVGSETRANVTVASDQYQVVPAALADGGFAFVWQSLGQDGSDYGVYARFFNADGTARTGEVQINQTTAGRQDLPTLERLADGSLIAAWRSYDATGQ